jgi:outer membrane protein assembly factor BamB
MAVSEPRPQTAVRSASWADRVVWGLIALLALMFAGLTLYRIRNGDIDEANPQQLTELQAAAPKAPRVAAPTGGDWPQWRGSNRDGVSTETGLLTTWPDEGPKVLWKAPLSPPESLKVNGYSSVVLAHGRAITMFQDDEYEAVICWDGATGAELWRFRYPAHFPHWQFGDGPRSTPAIAGDRVYTVGGTGILHCLKLFPAGPAGESIWTKNLLDEFDGKQLDWGIAFSPLVEKNLVFVMPGGKNGNGLAALDVESGSVVWHAFNDAASYSSPIAADLAGTRQIVFLTQERLLGVVPETGQLLWEFPWPSGPAHTPSSIATPLIIHRDVGDYVFISSGYDKGCALIKIEKDGEAFRATQVYRNLNLRTVFSSCVAIGDYVYGFDDVNLACIDVRNGKRQWKKFGFGKGSVVLADGHLIILGDDGTLAMAAADPREYREVARYQPPDAQLSSWTVPVLAGGRLYVRDRKQLVCYDLKKGA